MVLDVVQILAYAIEIAAMAASFEIAVCLLPHAFHIIVGGVAIGEAVGRDEVDSIAIVKAFQIGPAGLSFIQRPAEAFQQAVAFAEANINIACLGIFADSDIQKEVIGALGPDGLKKLYAFMGDTGFPVAYIFPINQKLNFALLHTNPPIRGLDSLYGVLGERRRNRNKDENKKQDAEGIHAGRFKGVFRGMDQYMEKKDLFENPWGVGKTLQFVGFFGYLGSKL